MNASNSEIQKNIRVVLSDMVWHDFDKSIVIF